MPDFKTDKHTEININRYKQFYTRLTDKIKQNNYKILSFDTLLTDITEKNTSIVFLRFGDVPCDISLLEDMENVALERNIKFTIITDVFYRNSNTSNTSNIKIITVNEFYGIYYNDCVKLTPGYTKLYNLLIQRTVLPRLHQFAELARNCLIDDGYVSLLGFQINNTNTPSKIVNDINKTYDSLYSDVLSNIEIPFTNFVEPNDLYILEEDTKYSVVFETYNDTNNYEWCAFTEKTFRSLQTSNISLLQNKTGSIEILSELGFKFHSINYILDAMPGYVSQTAFVVALLKNDMFEVFDMTEYAVHNQAILKDMLNNLQSDQLCERIVEQIL